MRAPPRRILAELSFTEIAPRLKASSILCLPLGAVEQHGAHLPLNTDMIVAERLTHRIVTRWGEKFDLWQLPTIPFGLSREHDWAPGTLSLSIDGFISLIRDLAREIVRALPARNLAIINGHGGNRGILENLVHELRGDFALNSCVIHPFDIAKNERAALPDVHGGRDETSVMLVLAPELVRLDLIGATRSMEVAFINEMIFDRGVSWPWRTDDQRLTRDGVIGKAADCSNALGEAIISSVVEEAGPVFARLLDRQKIMQAAPSAPLPHRRASPARTSSRSGNRRRPRSKERS